ncbi:MAG: hypothetical protein BMS9Abin22_493 [Gammaproteobacteria bacterium]|nr:MAG: hypothetical protein BMS9Abin22_493 [Gammaproteobacteria bacterium]
MLPKLLEEIAKVRVMVVGDTMLDRYWHGGVERISPEAPVPVVAVTKSDERPGGAANVARNVQALGARCTLLSITGDDREADSLQDLLEKAGIECRLYRDKLINTTVKLRVLSQNQQLLRVDFESPISKDARVRLLDYYLKHLSDCDVVIISDYGKGGLGYIQEMISVARTAGRSVVVDPKGDDYSSYRGATFITPNRKEFERVAGRFHDNKDLEKKAAAMAADLEIEGILVTRGDEGMSLIDRKGQVLHIPARAREVFDVTGAGDTVIATIGCAAGANAELGDVVHLANIAAGIVVGKLGAATATPKEILHELAVEEG